MLENPTFDHILYIYCINYYKYSIYKLQIYRYRLKLMMKKINEQVDSSSSEDEKFANILKEAIDQQFLNNNLYSIEKAEAIPQSGK